MSIRVGRKVIIREDEEVIIFQIDNLCNDNPDIEIGTIIECGDDRIQINKIEVITVDPICNIFSIIMEGVSLNGSNYIDEPYHKINPITMEVIGQRLCMDLKMVPTNEPIYTDEGFNSSPNKKERRNLC